MSFDRNLLYRIFPKKDNVIYTNLQVDSEVLLYITHRSDSEKISSLIIQKLISLDNNKTALNSIIVDATACIGGDTITFCKNFGIVIPIEENSLRFKYLINNLKVYEFNNVYPIEGNAMDMIPNIEMPIDVIYIDPPWGGKEYKLQEKLELSFATFALEDVIIKLFGSIKSLKIIALKLPKNYDYENFQKKLDSTYTVAIHKFLRKIDIVIVDKKI